jgi:hypothetical protein
VVRFPIPVSPIRASNVSKNDIVEREGLPSRRPTD